jgi:hypothetical protein
VMVGGAVREGLRRLRRRLPAAAYEGDDVVEGGLRVLECLLLVSLIRSGIRRKSATCS